MMKSLFKALVPAAALFLTACHSEERQDTPVTPGSKAQVSVKVTKSGYSGNSAVSEGGVETVHAYAYDRKGNLVMSRGNEGDSVLFYLPSGMYDVLAFANCIGLPHEPAEQEEIWNVPIYLLDNDPQAPMMSGMQDGVDVVKDYVLDMKLQRYLAKVNWIIKDSIVDEFYEGMNFVIQDVYLTNVPGENNLGLTAYPGTDGLWYNKMNYLRGDADSLLYSGLLQIPMEVDDTLFSAKTLYCFPNITVDPVERKPWSARSTRLVIRATLAEYVYYYPVTITPVTRNTAYNVEVVITGPGFTDPEDPGIPVFMNVRVKFAPWDDNPDIEAEI